jgi:hypothetical protein
MQMTQIGAWGLGLGTLFFSLFGIRAEKDFFLMIGLVACVTGDVLFAFFLWDQAEDGASNSNDTAATFYLMLALLATYGIYCQFNKYRDEGCGLDEDDDEEEEAEAAAAAAARAAPAIADRKNDAVVKRKSAGAR